MENIQTISLVIQGDFFNWDPPKNHKYGKKLEYLNWDPPKNHKYGKKLKYPNWDPLKFLSMTASQLNPSYECGEGMKVKVVKWC